MADVTDMIRIERDDDPRRCQSVRQGQDQCRFVATPGSENCRMHGGTVGGLNREKVRMFHLQTWNQRMGEFADHPEIKSLREEIGITRMVLETQMNRCKDATDLLLNSSRIMDIIDKIKGLVVSCDKLEEKGGMLLDKNAAIQLGNQIVSIITSEIDDEDVLMRISQKIVDVLLKIGSQRIAEPISIR